MVTILSIGVSFYKWFCFLLDTSVIVVTLLSMQACAACGKPYKQVSNIDGNFLILNDNNSQWKNAAHNPVM